MPRTLLKVCDGWWWWFESEFSVHIWSEVSAKVRTKLKKNKVIAFDKKQLNLVTENYYSLS